MKAPEGSITGRFAPTPSGPLHMGSLVTAVASYCQAKSMGGRWLVRMEDLDTPRIIKGSAADILRTLESFGFEWDTEVLFQSHRFAVYEEILQLLVNNDLIYGCNCSRKYLKSKKPENGPLGYIYPGCCRVSKHPLQTINLRLNTNSAGIFTLKDGHFGDYRLDVSHEVGDVILKRSDGIYAYHLAVVVDDAFQHVNAVVRGADLLEASCLHLFLQQLLLLPSPSYHHIPVLKNHRGEKLSKQTGAAPIDKYKAGEQLVMALNFLGQNTPLALQHYRPAVILQYAISHWDSRKIP